MASAQPAAFHSLEIRLFGPFEMRLGGIPLPRLRSHTGQWLLALLILQHERETERTWLAETLWPDSMESVGLANLRRTLTDLRRSLLQESWRLLSPTPRTLQLDLSGAFCDVMAFDAAVMGGDEAALQEAVALYRAPLLHGCSEGWILSERQVREQAYLQALEKLAGYAVGRGDFAAAVHTLRQAVAMDPMRESAQRRLMEALAAEGEYPAAMQVYRDLRTYLHEEMNAEPDPQTRALYERLRQQAAQRGQIPALPQPTVRPSRPARAVPHPLSSLVGRETEIGEIKALLARARLVTLTGAGGIGKTRLAIRLAQDLDAEYSSGAWFVDLAVLADPALVAQKLCTTLGLREDSDASPQEALISYLQARSLLLVLDNCEHLIDACARLADTLLEACPALTILATSREPLNIRGERPWRVPSLAVPDTSLLTRPEKQVVSILAEYDAVRLFVERAAQQRSAFMLTRDNASAVVQICRQLDGIPLALELAAAQVRGLVVDQIASRLEDRFHLLRGGTRGSLPRHQTLQSLLDWSYDLLSEPERRLLCRLAVFAGGWSLEAAETVCGRDEGRGTSGAERRPRASVRDESESLSPLHPEDRVPQVRAGHTPSPLHPSDVLDLLLSLVDKSLVVYEEQGGQARYRFLETTRAYALERLTAEGEARRWRDRHAEYFQRLVTEANVALQGPEQAHWFHRLEDEHDNFRSALQWYLEESRVGSRESRERPDELPLSALDSRPLTPGEAGLRLAESLSYFWEARGYLSEGRRWLAALLAQPSEGPPTKARGQALHEAGWLARCQGDLRTARALLEEGLAVRQEIGDLPGIAYSLDCLGVVTQAQGDHAPARLYFEEGLSLRRQLGDKADILSSLLSLGNLTRSEEDLASARLYFQESLQIAREMGNSGRIAQALSGLGSVAVYGKEYDAAWALFEESLAISRELGNESAVAWALHHLGGVARRQEKYAAAQRLYEESLALHQHLEERGGIAATLYALGHLAAVQQDYASAHSYYTRSLTLSHELGVLPGVVDALERLAGLAATPGQFLRAARLFGAAGHLRTTMDTARPSSSEETDQERIQTPARAALGEEAFAAAWAEGCAMTLEQAIAYALEENSGSEG